MLSFMLLSLTVASAMLPMALGATFSHLSRVPSGWEPLMAYKTAAKGASNDAESKDIFTIALQLKNLDKLEDKLLELSTPGKPNYGKWMTKEEVDAMFGPSSEAVSTVTAWLTANGITGYRVDGGYIDFAADVTTANALLDANYQRYRHDGKIKLRTLGYSMPDQVAKHVAYLDPSTYFGGNRAFRPVKMTETPDVLVSPLMDESAAVDPTCARGITPSCLKQMYHINDYKPSATSGSRVAFASFLNQSASYDDIKLFEQRFGIPGQSFNKELINGGVNDQNPNTADVGEANLDAQCILGISNPLPVTEYITGGSPPFVPTIDQPTPADNFNEPYLEYLRYLLNKTNADIPQVISHSYGDQEHGVPQDYAILTCNLFGLLALRGITSIFSSGDIGVGSGCLAPDYETVIFDAIYPATCPYLTSVGGLVSVDPEIAWEGSSGGFSRYFSRPSWQFSAVGSYIKYQVDNKTRQYYSQYNNWDGRGFPDVALHSIDPGYVGYYYGRLFQNGGTSAAAPVFAALIAMLNDAKLRAGKPTLGWLNPLIYGPGADIWGDVIAGHAKGCDGRNYQSGQKEPPGSGIVPGAQWNATTGWDPVTGFGTPDFSKLLKLVMTS